MTDFALNTEMARQGELPPSGPPPVKPAWLRPVAAVAIVLAHVGVFALLMHTAIPQTVSLDSINMDLVPEGDFFDQEAQVETEDTPPPEQIEEPELALPPPMVMSPDAPPLPMKKEEVEKVVKPKPKEEQREVQHAQQRQESRAERRYGSPEGHAQGSGASQATCLAHVAASLRQHTPGATSLGPGSAHVTFHVNAGGGISSVSASGSSPAHAALARRIVSSSHGPGNCGSAFVSQGFTFH